jgi:hypothetical protein
VVVLVAAPEAYDQDLRLPKGASSMVEIAFLTTLSAFIALVCRHRWRGAFWLIFVAFLTGRLRCRRPSCSPRVSCTRVRRRGTWPFRGSSAWFSSIALAMLAGYRAAASGSVLRVTTAEARWEACQQGCWPPDGRIPAAAALSADTPGDLPAGRPVGDPDRRAAAARSVITPVRVP